MFEKFSHHSFRRTLQNVKNHLGNGYNHLKNIAHHIDHGFQVAKHVYSVLEPHIRQAAGNNQIHGHAMKAINGYENIRNKVMDGNHKVEEIGHKLRGLV
jgi:hypothetical protein